MIKLKEQSLYYYDEAQEVKCKHDFGNLDRPIWEMPFETQIIVHPCGDCFVQKLKCKKCGLIVSKLFSNKCPEYIVNFPFPKD